jgi:hypothetical protein
MALAGLLNIPGTGRRYSLVVGSMMERTWATELFEC